MLSYFKINSNVQTFQELFSQYRLLFDKLIKKYVPLKYQNRRNIEHTKISDASIMAMMCLKVQYRISSWISFYRLFKLTLPNEPMLEYSRLLRRRKRLALYFQLIRQGLLTQTSISTMAIMDSFPLPLCQPIRNRRAKIFSEVANIGYSATKKIYLYGFKIHMVVSINGLILKYEVTPASVNDAKVASELIADCPCSQVLADVGYIGKKIVQEFREMGYQLWTPFRSNMKGAKRHNNSLLNQIRRRIETCFSQLKLYGSEETHNRSLEGFQADFESIITLYNLQKMEVLQTSN